MSKTYTLNRCRPVHEGEWSNTKTYLELSVVYDPITGDSYTSRIPVPAGTLLTNVTYWVKSSDFNSQLVEKGNYYDNVAAMKADNSLTEGMTAITKGYYEPNDGGGAIYNIVSGVFLNSATYQQIGTSSLYANLIAYDEINARVFGVKENDPDNDYTLQLQDAIDYAIETGAVLNLNKGVVYYDDSLVIWGTCRIVGTRGKSFGSNPTLLNYRGVESALIIRKKLTADGDFVPVPVNPADPSNNVGSLFVERVNFIRNRTNDTSYETTFSGNVGKGIDGYFMSEFRFQECGFIGFNYGAYIPTCSIGEFIKCDFVYNSYGVWGAPAPSSDPVRGTKSGMGRVSFRDCNSWNNYEASFVPGNGSILFDGCHTEVTKKHFYFPIGSRNRIVNNITIEDCNCNSGEGLEGFAAPTLDATWLSFEVEAGTSSPIIEAINLKGNKVWLKGTNAKPIYFNKNGTVTTITLDLAGGNKFNCGATKVIHNEEASIYQPVVIFGGQNISRNASDAGSVVWGDGAHTGFTPGQLGNVFNQGIRVGQRIDTGVSMNAGQIEYNSSQDRFDMKHANKTVRLIRTTFSATPPTDDGTHAVGDLIINTGVGGGKNWGWVVTNISPFYYSTLGQIGYRTNAGAPSSITPNFVGEELLDTSVSKWYKSFGLGVGEWTQISN